MIAVHLTPDSCNIFEGVQRPNLGEKKVVIVGTGPFVKNAEKVRKIVFGQGFKLDMKKVEGTNSYVLEGGAKAEKPKAKKEAKESDEKKEEAKKEEAKPAEEKKKILKS